MLATLIWLKAPALLGWIGILFVLERLAPFAPLPPSLRNSAARLRRVGRNLGLAATTALLSLALAVPLSVMATAHPLWTRPPWLGGPGGLVADLLLLDIWIYFWHRANHEVPFLWRFHQVHHRDEFLDTTSALQFHFGEVLLSAMVRGGVIVLVALPLASVLLFEAAVTASAVFHHSNVRLPPRLERLLAVIIVTPSRHWVHHHAIRADTDSNYAAICAWWDWLFGSRSATPRTPELPIGVEGASDKPLPSLLWLPCRGVTDG